MPLPVRHDGDVTTFAEAGAGMAVEFSPLGPVTSIPAALAVVKAAGVGRAGVVIDSWHFFRFGIFSGLHGIHSSSTDIYPSQPTLTFYGSAYTSRYLVFTPVETTTQNPNTPLQSPTAAEQALLSRYDAPPYVPAADAGSITASARRLNSASAPVQSPGETTRPMPQLR